MKKVALLGVLGLLVACGSSKLDPGPEPADPVVYNASTATTSDLGIVKWGFTGDVDGDTIFRGYGAKNEPLVELHLGYAQQDDFTKRFTMSMSGALGTATETIDLGATVSADFQDVQYTQNIIEDGFATGVPAKVLAHLTPDAVAMATVAANQDGLAPTQGLHPADESSSGSSGSSTPLLNTPTTLLQCCSQVTQQSAPLAASAASSCGLVSAPESLVNTQSGELDPEALGVGADGKPVVQSPWAGPYDIVDNHCHNAAAQNSSATDGYIACTGTSSTTSTQGHTINWAPNPTADAGAGSYCAYEPQSNGGTLLTSSVCCWSGTAGANGAPQFNSPAAQGCVNQLCLGQAAFGGATPPTAFPAGSKPPTPNDCPSSTNALISCNSCCTTQANTVGGLFGSTPKYKAQVDAYRQRCAVNCKDADTKRNPPPSTCTTSTMDWIRSKLGMKNACSASK